MNETLNTTTMNLQGFNVERQFFLGKSFDEHENRSDGIYLALHDDPDTPAMVHYRGDTCTVWLAEDQHGFGGSEYEFPFEDAVYEKLVSYQEIYNNWINRF